MAPSDDRLSRFMAEFGPQRDVESRRVLSELRQRLFTPGDAPTVDRFEQLERIGHGGMGVVYRAWDPLLERRVAIKVLHPRTRDPGRILDEARALATLAHPNIVAVLDVGREGLELFVVMEYVEGRTLAELMERRPSLSELAPLFDQMAEGLAAAHAHGLVHHDIKPSNVLITEDAVARIADFGLARLLREHETHAVGGTRGFAAPEQLAGQPSDARADLYSLTAIVYLAHFGEHPAAFDETRDFPSRPPIPKRLETFLRRGLARNPEDRFEDAKGWQLALRSATKRRGWGPLSTLGSLAALVAGAALWSSVAGQGAPCERDWTRESLWEAEASASTASHFQASAQEFTRNSFAHVDHQMTTAAEAWQRARVSACAAEDQVASACLDAQRPGFGEVVSWLGEASDDELERLPEVLQALPNPSDCTQVGPSPAPPALLQAVDEALARAGAMLSAGHYAQAVELLHQTELPSGTRAHSDRLAAHAYVLGRALKLAGQHTAAAAEFEKAYLLRLLSEQDTKAAEAAANLAALYALERAQPSAARRWIRNARAALVRRPSTPAARGSVYLQLAGAHYGLAELEEASVALTEADRLLDPQSPRRVDLEAVRAGVHYQAGNLDAAIEAQQSSLQASIVQFGQAHPRLVAPITNLAILQEEHGKPELARRGFEDALALAETTLGPAHVQTAMTRISLASHGLGRRDPDETIALFERALADLETAVGPSNLLLYTALQGLAEAFVMAERPADAERTIVRAIDIAKQQEMLDPRARAGVFSTYASTLRMQGRTDEGIEAANEALRVLLEAFGDSHPNIATVRLELSKLRLDRDEPMLARQEMAAAVEVLRAAFGPEHPQVLDIESRIAATPDSP